MRRGRLSCGAAGEEVRARWMAGWLGAARVRRVPSSGVLLGPGVVGSPWPGGPTQQSSDTDSEPGDIERRRRAAWLLAARKRSGGLPAPGELPRRSWLDQIEGLVSGAEAGLSRAAAG